MKNIVRRIFLFAAFALVTGLFAGFPTAGILKTAAEDAAAEEPVNVAPDAEYKGGEICVHSAADYGEAGFWKLDVGTQEDNVYHKGKLNDGVVSTEYSNQNSGLGQNIEFLKSGFGVGRFYLYFRLAAETQVRQVNVYANIRSTAGNRVYPLPFDVYVGSSEEDVSDAALLGQANTADEGKVRKYTAAGDKTGTFVIIDTQIPPKSACITFCEVEIMGIAGETHEPPPPPPASIPALDAPVLTSSAPKLETYEIPTISWEAVPDATGYDVYLDGKVVAEGITELSYVPDIVTRSDYAGNSPSENNDHYRVQVVAKGDGTAFADSEKSAEVGIMYVEKPTDSQGNPVTSADIILDAGHGGRDPGASGFGRDEKDDTLNMTLKVGKYFEDLGFTVAYTRISDISDTRRTKGAKGEAGDFKFYICIHRNAFSNPKANGLEVLYPTGDNVDKAFAKAVCDELDGLGLFTKRGLKARDYHGTISNVSMPVILTELGFITNEKDNATFDEYFDSIAAAIIKGTMKYARRETDFTGTLTVNGTDYSVSRADHTVDAGTAAEGSALSYKFVGSHGLGFRYLQMQVDDGEWTTVEPLDAYFCDTELGSHKYGTFLSYEGSADLAGMAAGAHTLTVRVGTLLDTAGSVHPAAEETLFAINVTIEGKETAVSGDVNGDGKADNLDAAMVLQYDAGIVGEDGINLSAADVNRDGAADNLDASIILQYDAGIVTSIGGI